MGEYTTYGARAAWKAFLVFLSFSHFCLYLGCYPLSRVKRPDRLRLTDEKIDRHNIKGYSWIPSLFQTDSPSWISLALRCR
jgi:hypothetical protein